MGLTPIAVTRVADSIAQASDGGVFATWMLWFAFVASAALTLLKIGELILAATRRPKLEVRLTKEIEFRILDSGDSIFANAVLLAKNGPLLITDASMVLSKIDGARKQYPLEIIRFGEKVTGAGPIADNSFVTTSPLCAHSEYKDKYLKLVNDFYSWAWEKKTELGELDLDALSGDEAQAILTKWRSDMKESASLFMDEVQIEGGRYRLTLTIGSKGLGRFAKNVQQSSSIEFSIGSDVRERFRAQLPATLEALLGNTLFPNQSPAPVYPSHQPVDATEL